MEYRPDPGLRPPQGRRPPTRQQVARRRGFAAFLVVVAVLILWAAWPGGGTEQRTREGPSSPPTTPGKDREGEPKPPTSYDIGPDSPIEHVVFIVKENRSFNNYFATYPGAAGATEGGTIECNSDGCKDGPVVQLKIARDVQDHDLTHCFRCGLVAINNGKMNGYNRMNGVIAASAAKQEVYGSDRTGYTYFRRSGIPNYYAYADRFVLADHFFTSMYGPTLPEHLYAVAAQSNGIVDNKCCTDTSGSYCTDSTEFSPRFRPGLTRGETRTIMRLEKHINDNRDNTYAIARYWDQIRLCFNIKVLPDLLERRGISWKYYATENSWMNALQMIRHVWEGPMRQKIRPPEDFLKDVRKGRLPHVSWLIPPEPYNEHPGAGKSVCAGENWTVQHVNALMKSEYWRNTVIVMVWDDFGGFYDPVLPPALDIMGLGIRTPALIISPYTRQGDNPDGGYVDETVYEFSSVLRFIELLNGLKPMTERDAQASPLAGAFDFQNPNFKKLLLDYRTDCPYGTTLGDLTLASVPGVGFTGG